MTVPKPLKLLLITGALSLTTCTSCILHKDGMKAAVTAPIVASIDKLEIKKLVDSSTKTIDKLNESIDAAKPDLVEVAKNLKEITTKLNVALGEIKESSKESLLWRILPPAIIILSILIALFIIVKVLR